MGERILVLGGTGLLGEPVANGLREAGFAVRVMSRDAQSVRARFDAPFEIVTGDALDAADVEKAIRGCEAVHISIDHEDEDECVTQVLEAASGQGLRRITYISGVTVCEENRWFPLVDRKLRSEQAIRASGIEYTIFRPGWFMEMLARFVQGDRVFVFGKPKRRWHFVALDDLARMVVESYRRPQAANKTFYVHGPEALTVLEAQRRYCRVLHPDVGKLRGTPYWMLRLIARLTRNTRMQKGTEMVHYLERVGERGDPSEANAILGAPEITLELWLRMRCREKAEAVDLLPDAGGPPTLPRREVRS